MAICLLTSGCDKNEKDINVSEYKYYINDTEHYDISTYNGYKCIEIKNENEEGIYTITFKFSKVGE